ncbi:MAG: AAA family ATPase [Firmicutes bacterium]|nr:AAA family ATPase [Bacillota bacterium]
MTNNEKKNNIVLIGFMGSGKTVVGRTLAGLLDYDFVDTDEQIRQVTGLTLPQLFRKHGEIRFRSEEELVVKRTAAKQKQVIATGGSLTPMAKNFDLLRQNGWFVLLSADPQTILSRISRKNDRLLLCGKPDLPSLENMVREREEAYRQTADFIVDTTKMGVEDAAAAIARQYRAYAAGE